MSGAECQASDYWLYQLHVRSDWPLAGLPVVGTSPDLTLARGGQAPFECRPETRLYANTMSAAEMPFVEFHRKETWEGTWYCLKYPAVAEFYFELPHHVLCIAADDAPAEQIVNLFQGPVCALLLEFSGLPCIHACCVQIGARTVAFAGPSGAGKSTLAAHWVEAGHRLIADDVLPLKLQHDRCLTIPSFPQLKLVLQGESQKRGKQLLNLADGNKFADRSLPLSTIYVIDRDTDPIAAVEIEPVSAAEALVELVRHSFCARVVSVLEFDRFRFGLLATIAECITVCRLEIPNSHGRLPEVRAAVLAREQGTEST